MDDGSSHDGHGGSGITRIKKKKKVARTSMTIDEENRETDRNTDKPNHISQSGICISLRIFI